MRRTRQRNAEGIRLLPDGAAALICVRASSDLSEDVDTLHLIGESLEKSD